MSNIMPQNRFYLAFQGFFCQYKFSEAGSLGNLTFDEYVLRLNPKQITISEDENFKRICWEDFQSLFIFRFDKNGKFLIVEREVWYEYKFFLFGRKTTVDINKA